MKWEWEERIQGATLTYVTFERLSDKSASSEGAKKS